MQTDIPIKDVMVRNVVKADMNVDVKKAAWMMIKNDVDSVVVLNKGEPVGIVTEREIIRNLVTKDIKPSTVKLKDIMAKPLVTVSPNERLSDVARRMATEKIRRMPVINNGKLVGIIADIDIISASSNINSILAELMEINVGREEIRGKTGEDFSQGICEKCGSFSSDLRIKDGLLVCESCSEEIEV